MFSDFIIVCMFFGKISLNFRNLILFSVVELVSSGNSLCAKRLILCDKFVIDSFSCLDNFSHSWYSCPVCLGLKKFFSLSNRSVTEEMFSTLSDWTIKSLALPVRLFLISNTVLSSGQLHSSTAFWVWDMKKFRYWGFPSNCGMFSEVIFVCGVSLWWWWFQLRC